MDDGDEGDLLVENLERCRTGHEYVVMLCMNVNDAASSYLHEESMAYCPVCGSPSEAMVDTEPSIAGAELEQLRSFYEAIYIQMHDELKQIRRLVHVDVIEDRRKSNPLQ